MPITDLFVCIPPPPQPQFIIKVGSYCFLPVFHIRANRLQGIRGLMLKLKGTSKKSRVVFSMYVRIIVLDCQQFRENFVFEINQSSLYHSDHLLCLHSK